MSLDHFSQYMKDVVIAAVPGAEPGKSANDIFKTHGIGAKVTTKNILREMAAAGVIKREPAGKMFLYRRAN